MKARWHSDSDSLASIRPFVRCANICSGSFLFLYMPASSFIALVSPSFQRIWRHLLSIFLKGNVFNEPSARSHSALRNWNYNFSRASLALGRSSSANTLCISASSFSLVSSSLKLYASYLYSSLLISSFSYCYFVYLALLNLRLTISIRTRTFVSGLSSGINSSEFSRRSKPSFLPSFSWLTAEKSIQRARACISLFLFEISRTLMIAISDSSNSSLL